MYEQVAGSASIWAQALLPALHPAGEKADKLHSRRAAPPLPALYDCGGKTAKSREGLDLPNGRTMRGTCLAIEQRSPPSLRPTVLLRETCMTSMNDSRQPEVRDLLPVRPAPPVLVATITRALEERLGYPGEARHIALVRGLGGELWYDDGSYSGLARLSFQEFLRSAEITELPCSPQRDSPPCPSFTWLCLDRASLALFYGDHEQIAPFLQKQDAHSAITRLSHS